MSTKSSRVEDRVNRVRQALNSQLLDTGASAPLLSEEAVAVIVAAEARRSRELASKLGPRAYLVSGCCIREASTTGCNIRRPLYSFVVGARFTQWQQRWRQKSE
jgi:hypothetical protein